MAPRTTRTTRQTTTTTKGGRRQRLISFASSVHSQQVRPLVVSIKLKLPANNVIIFKFHRSLAQLIFYCLFLSAFIPPSSGVPLAASPLPAPDAARFLLTSKCPARLMASWRTVNLIWLHLTDNFQQLLLFLVAAATAAATTTNNPSLSFKSAQLQSVSVGFSLCICFAFVSASKGAAKSTC